MRGARCASRLARRIMHAACTTMSLPKGMSDALMTVHAKHPFPDTPTRSARPHARCAIQLSAAVSREGIHVYNRDGHAQAQDAFTLWPQLKLHDDAPHAFYMAWRLHAPRSHAAGQALCTGPAAGRGCASNARADDLSARCAPGPTLKAVNE